MPNATYSPTTSASGLNKLWRKVQGEVATGLNYACEEWQQLEDLEDFNIDWSFREITFPLRINKGFGVSSIPEGGWEARPSSPNLEECTINWVQFNKRFTATLMAMYVSQKNAGAALKQQLMYQAMDAVDTLAAHFSDYFYGVSTAVLALTDTDVSGTSGTLTLKNGYGQSTITDAAYIASLFRVGDVVALVASGSDALIDANAIGTITAITPATPSIAVTFIGSVGAYTTNNIRIVKANSVDQTITGTDLNRGVVGLLDFATSTTVQGLASSSVADWSPAMADTTGGRLTGIRIRKAKNEIKNYGGGTADTMIVDQGVYRDMIAHQQAALRFSDPFALELDADIKNRGTKFFHSRRTPPSFAWLMAKRSFKRMNLLPKPTPGGTTWKDGEKLEDRNALVFSMDWPVQLVTTNRKDMAYWSGLTRQ
jgi:hypothetical protein